MALDQIYVSGSNLVWVDSGTSYLIKGAEPVSGSVTTPSQPAGRIWVSQTYLYYSDGGGLTRFVSGILADTTASFKPGRVYTNQLDCPDYLTTQPAQDIFWVGSNSSSYYARANNGLPPIFQTLQVNVQLVGPTRDNFEFRAFYGGGNPTDIGTKQGIAIKNETVTSGYFVNFYSGSTTCAGTPLYRAQLFDGVGTVNLPASIPGKSVWFITSSYTVNDDLYASGDASYKVVASYVNVRPADAGALPDSTFNQLNSSSFCVGIDKVKLLIKDSGSCVVLATSDTGNPVITPPTLPAVTYVACGATCEYGYAENPGTGRVCGGGVGNPGDCPYCVAGVCSDVPAGV